MSQYSCCGHPWSSPAAESRSAFRELTACNNVIPPRRVITQRVLVIRYRRFGTTSRPHLQGSRIQKERR